MSVESPRPESKANEGTEAESSAETETSKKENADSILRVRNLRKRYGGESDGVTAVDDVSFDVDRGSVVGLLGPNGAGKTTIIKSILGLILPTDGRVVIDGVDVHADTKRAYRHVGAMLEGARNVYWRLTVRENLQFFAALAGQRPAATRDRHDELLEQFGLADKADTPVRELSRGMKGKVSLACTLARDWTSSSSTNRPSGWTWRVRSNCTRNSARWRTRRARRSSFRATTWTSSRTSVTASSS